MPKTNEPTAAQALYWAASRVITGRKRFVNAGSETWREAIAKWAGPVTLTNDRIDAIEAEIHRLLPIPVADRAPLSELLAPEIRGRAKEPIPSSGRRVVRKGEPFS